MTEVIYKLNDFKITSKIIWYFFKKKNKGANLEDFLKFIKILFDKIKDLDFMLNIFREIKS